MGERDTRRDTDQASWSARAPRVADALKRGVLVSVETRDGKSISGRVCDREASGLLLDIENPGDEREGLTSYVFLPWTSVDQVAIRDVVTRRVKYLRDG